MKLWMWGASVLAAGLIAMTAIGAYRSANAINLIEGTSWDCYTGDDGGEANIKSRLTFEKGRTIMATLPSAPVEMKVETPFRVVESKGPQRNDYYEIVLEAVDGGAFPAFVDAATRARWSADEPADPFAATGSTVTISFFADKPDTRLSYDTAFCRKL